MDSNKAAELLAEAHSSLLSRNDFGSAKGLAEEAMELFTQSCNATKATEAFMVCIEADMLQAQLEWHSMLRGFLNFQSRLDMLQQRTLARLSLVQDAEDADMTAEGILQLLLVKIYMARRTLPQLEAAEEAMEECLWLLKNADDRKSLLRSYLLRAELSLLRGQRTAAEEVLHEAQRLLPSDDRFGKAQILHWKGMCRKQDEEIAGLRDAAGFLREAAEIYFELSLPLQSAQEQAVLADVYALMGNNVSALSAAHEASNRMSDEDIVDDTRASLLATMVSVHLDCGDAEAAQDVAAEACRSAGRIGDKWFELIAREQEILILLHGARLDAAMKAARALSDEAAAFGDPDLEAKAHMAMAQTCLRKGYLEDAGIAAEEAVAVLKRSRVSPSAVGSALLGRAQVELVDAKAHTGFGLATALEAEEVYSKVGDAVGAGRACLQQAHAYDAAERLDAAINTCRVAIQKFADVKSRRWQDTALNLLADIWAKAGKVEDALKTREEQRAMLHDAGLRKQEAKALQAISSLYLGMGEQEKALHACNTALNVAKSTKDSFLQISLHLQGIDIQLELARRIDVGEMSDALRHWQDDVLRFADQAAQLAIKSRPSGGSLLGHALYARARALDTFHKPEIATSTAASAVTHFSKDGNKVGMAHAYLLMACQYRGNAMIEECIEHAQLALRALQEAGNTDSEAAANARAILEEVGVQSEEPPAPKQLPTLPKKQEPVQEKEPQPAAPKKELVTFAVVQKKVRDTLANLITEEDDGQIANDVGFAELGLDSLSSMGLRTDLQQAFGVELPPTLAFDYPDIATLASYIFDELASAST